MSILSNGIPYQKDILNTAYHSLVTTGFTVAYLILARKIFKTDIGDPSRARLADVGKLGLSITAAEITKDWLVKNKVIPLDFPFSK